MGDLISRLCADVVAAYGSLEDPDFGFAAREYAKRPYDHLIARIRSRFTVQETTDLNDDVSVTLAVTGTEVAFSLYLSLVGRYAALFRVSGADIIEPIKESDLVTCREGAEFLSILVEHELRVLDPDVFRLEIPLRDLNSDSDKADFFSVLFTRSWVPF